MNLNPGLTPEPRGYLASLTLSPLRTGREKSCKVMKLTKECHPIDSLMKIFTVVSLDHAFSHIPVNVSYTVIYKHKLTAYLYIETFIFFFENT